MTVFKKVSSWIYNYVGRIKTSLGLGIGILLKGKGAAARGVAKIHDI
jgi:hypothetical protein